VKPPEEGLYKGAGRRYHAYLVTALPSPFVRSLQRKCPSRTAPKTGTHLPHIPSYRVVGDGQWISYGATRMPELLGNGHQSSKTVSTGGPIPIPTIGIYTVTGL